MLPLLWHWPATGVPFLLHAAAPAAASPVAICNAPADSRPPPHPPTHPRIDRVYIGSCTGGKTEDFLAAAKLLHMAGRQVKVPTYLVPATQKVGGCMGRAAGGCRGAAAGGRHWEGENNSPSFLPPSLSPASRPSLPPTQVWGDVYALPVPGCDGKTAAEIFEAAGCVTPAAPSCAACLGGPRDTFARMNEPEVCVSTTNRNFPGRMGERGAGWGLGGGVGLTMGAVESPALFEWQARVARSEWRGRRCWSRQHLCVEA